MQAPPFTLALPTTLAELQSGWEIWLQFALDAGAINSAEQTQLERRGETALQELGVNLPITKRAIQRALFGSIASGTGTAH
jgi:Flp pilus assembly protein CpaB